MTSATNERRAAGAENAVGWWYAERIDPDGFHPEPYVTLSIDGAEVTS